MSARLCLSWRIRGQDNGCSDDDEDSEAGDDEEAAVKIGWIR
jgi:hypothetical protein